ncbi:hypothetical protein BV22DRAFT_1188121 [Leucogyrophana mollusca]|uniref:Uncharacterized protein n=1 Tax=Leucogyrophana mollusca TaxID=85980 RepID=A0ACB8AX97_9AGAM|nr:hypothetical protein BV22DRAFT_1188121 [Leucogyrophana mollusca]
MSHVAPDANQNCLGIQAITFCSVVLNRRVRGSATFIRQHRFVLSLPIMSLHSRLEKIGNTFWVILGSSNVSVPRYALAQRPDNHDHLALPVAQPDRQPDWYRKDHHWQAFIPTTMAPIQPRWFIELPDEVPSVTARGGGLSLRADVATVMENDIVDVTQLFRRVSQQYFRSDRIPKPQCIDGRKIYASFPNTGALDAMVQEVKQEMLDCLAFLHWFASWNDDWIPALDLQNQAICKVFGIGQGSVGFRGVLVDLWKDWRTVNIPLWIEASVPVLFPWTSAEASHPRFYRLSPTHLKASNLAMLPDHLVHASTVDPRQFDEFLQEIRPPRTPVFGQIFSKKATSIWALDFEGWKRRPIDKGEQARFTAAWYCREIVDEKYAVHRTYYRYISRPDPDYDAMGTVAQTISDSSCHSREQFRFGYSPPPGYYFDDMGIEAVKEEIPVPPHTSFALADTPSTLLSVPAAHAIPASSISGPGPERAPGHLHGQRYVPYPVSDRHRRGYRSEKVGAPATSSHFVLQEHTPSPTDVRRFETLVAQLRRDFAHATIEPPVLLDQPTSDIQRDIRWNPLLLRHGVLILSSRAEVALRYRALVNKILSVEEILTRAVILGIQFQIAVPYTALPQFIPQLDGITRRNDLQKPPPYLVDGYVDQLAPVWQNTPQASAQWENSVRALLKRPHAGAYILKGGIFWRLAMEFGPPGILQSVADGPSISSTLQSFHTRQYKDGFDFVHEKVAEGEMSVMLGLERGKHSKFLWPPPEAGLPCFDGEWNTITEEWFLGHLAKVHKGRAILKTQGQWQQAWRGYRKRDTASGGIVEASVYNAGKHSIQLATGSTWNFRPLRDIQMPEVVSAST